MRVQSSVPNDSIAASSCASSSCVQYSAPRPPRDLRPAFPDPDTDRGSAVTDAAAARAWAAAAVVDTGGVADDTDVVRFRAEPAVVALPAPSAPPPAALPPPVSECVAMELLRERVGVASAERASSAPATLPALSPAPAPTPLLASVLTPAPPAARAAASVGCDSALPVVSYR